jgi:hypothetical protein
MNKYSIKNLAASWLGRMRALRESLSWWMVSVMLHGLLIVLAGLMSMVVELGDNDDSMMVMVSDFVHPDKYMIPVSTKEENDDGGVIYCPGPVDPFGDSGFSGTAFGGIGLILSDVLEAQGHDDLGMSSFEGDYQGGSSNNGVILEDSIGTHNASDFSKGHSPGCCLHTERPVFVGRSNTSRSIQIYCGRDWETIRTVTDASLRWLAYNQEADGRWDAMKHGAAVKTDTAVTSLALLTLLGAGNSERVGAYKENVKRAVEWLKSKQAADGRIWDTSDDAVAHRKIGYPNAIATMAMAEAAGMGRVPDTLRAAQKAVDYCTEVHQTGEGYERGGWRYGPKQAGDLSVTGWYIMALKSAKIAGLRVIPAAFDGAINFLDSVEVRSSETASRYGYMVGNEKTGSAHRMGAIGNLSRQFMGWKKEDLQSSVEAFVAKGGLPSYGANGASVDLYYWYYATMCVFQQQDMGLWNRWNDAMIKAINDNQCTKGADAGSWAPVGTYSSEWGRVGQTALNLLCLEIYYRYDVIKP